MFSIKHFFQSAKADGTDSTLVKPSDWNHEHVVEASTDGVFIGRSPGLGSGPMEELPISSMFYPGMMMEFAGSVAPPGWAMCEGQSLLRVDYPALFLAIGATYGAVDAAHFSLPDKRGRTAVHPDGGTGRMPSWVAGTVGGNYQTQAFTSVTVGGSLGGSTGGQQSFNISGMTSTEGGGLGTVGGGPATGTHNHSFSYFGYTNGEALNVVVSGNLSGGSWSNLFSVVQPSICIPSIIKL